MMNQYPRSYVSIVTEMYHTLRKLQNILTGSDASAHSKHIDTHIDHILRLRAELLLSLADIGMAEEIYAIVLHYTLSPSQHAFIYTLKHFSREADRSDFTTSRPSLP